MEPEQQQQHQPPPLPQQKLAISPYCTPAAVAVHQALIMSCPLQRFMGPNPPDPDMPAVSQQLVWLPYEQCPVWQYDAADPPDWFQCWEMETHQNARHTGLLLDHTVTQACSDDDVGGNAIASGGENADLDALSSDSQERMLLREQCWKRKPLYGIARMCRSHRRRIPAPATPRTRINTMCHQGRTFIGDESVLLTHNFVQGERYATVVSNDPVVFGSVTDWDAVRREKTLAQVLSKFKRVTWPLTEQEATWVVTNGTCPISSCEFEQGEQLCIWPVCNHAGSHDGMVIWARSGGKCPVCRIPLESI